MARRSKIEVSAVNIRISADKKRDYATLMTELVRLKAGVRVYGDTYVAVTYFDPDRKLGIISKYSKIDVDGDWFDVDNFDIASEEDVKQINIPEYLRPNFSEYYFLLHSALHVIAFELYADSKGLSSKSVQKYFDEILRRTEISEQFGFVEADVIKSYSEVDRILSLPRLKELRFIIKRPNSDDISGDLASVIEERLSEQNAEVYDESIKSRRDDGLSPNERSRKLASVAAENGQLSAKSLVNGVMVSHDTKETPLKEVATFNRDKRNARDVFVQLAQAVFERVRKQRKST